MYVINFPFDVGRKETLLSRARTKIQELSTSPLLVPINMLDRSAAELPDPQIAVNQNQSLCIFIFFCARILLRILFSPGSSVLEASLKVLA